MHPIRGLPPNVDLLPSGLLRARVYVGGKRIPQTFPLDDHTRLRGEVSPALRLAIETWRCNVRSGTLETLQAYGDAPVAPRGRRREASDTLDAYAPRFLRQIPPANFKSARSHLRACQACVILLDRTEVRVGTLALTDITPEVLRLMIVAWQTAPSPHAVRRVRVAAYERGGVTMPAYERDKPVTSGSIAAPRTIRHRIAVLRQALTYRDKSAVLRFEGVSLPHAEDEFPIEVEETVIEQVAANLRRAAQPRTRVRPARDPAAWALREQKRQRDALCTLVRFLVLVTTGQRPCQLMRARQVENDVNLKKRIWIVRGAKLAPAFLLKLTTPMVRAWEEFIAADAWGDYDTSTHANRVHAAGWPVGVDPYHARHTLAMNGLNERDLDLAEVQAHLGHRQPTTTNKHYARVTIGRKAKTAAKLETRLASLFRRRKTA